jgi:uncharacterized protein
MTSKLITGLDHVNQLKEIVAMEYVPDSATHDATHLARVAALGQRICEAEGGNSLVVACAAWLHDLHRDARQSDPKFFLPPEQTDDRIKAYLAKAGIPENIHHDIVTAVHYTDRFSFSDRPTYQTTTEAMIVRDADCLDAIGAIGVARSFTFGGAHGIPIWNGAHVNDSTIYRQSERPASTIQHFYDKLTHLADDLETNTARELAVRRSAYLHEFLREFMNEWHEDFESRLPGSSGVA